MELEGKGTYLENGSKLSRTTAGRGRGTDSTLLICFGNLASLWESSVQHEVNGAAPWLNVVIRTIES